jgi:hypothetical protein
MAIFAKQYEAILATACVEACPEDIPKPRKGEERRGKSTVAKRGVVLKRWIRGRILDHFTASRKF